jgi:hypothetical protein
MADMAKADLDQVFAPGGAGAEETEPALGGEDDDAEMDDAVNTAIDEVFATEDPDARREAFKRAVGLCSDSKY